MKNLCRVHEVHHQAIEQDTEYDDEHNPIENDGIRNERDDALIEPDRRLIWGHEAYDTCCVAVNHGAALLWRYGSPRSVRSVD